LSTTKDGEEEGYKQTFDLFNLMVDAGMVNKKAERAWTKFLKSMRMRIDMNSVDKSVSVDEETFVHVLIRTAGDEAFDMREVADSLRFVEGGLAVDDAASTIQLGDIVSPKVCEEMTAIEAAAVITAPTPPRKHF